MNTDSLTMADVNRITRDFDNTGLFKERWGGDYVDRAMDFWGNVLNAYRNGEPVDLTKEEAMFVAVYHYAVGGHLPGEDDPIPFFKWILEMA